MRALRTRRTGLRRKWNKSEEETRHYAPLVFTILGDGSFQHLVFGILEDENVNVCKTDASIIQY